MKPKADKRLVEESKDPIKFKAIGFKEAIASLNKDPLKIIEESFESQLPFLKTRIVANLPKNSKTASYASNLELETIKTGNKVSIKVFMRGEDVVRAHEGSSPSTSISATPEGGAGNKFITRVFETHRDKIKEDVAKKLSEERRGRGQKNK